MALPVELLSEVVYEMVLGVLVFDPADGSCLYANKAAQEILEIGVSSEMFLLSSLFPEPNENRQARHLNSKLLEKEGLLNDVVVRKCDNRNIVASIGVKRLLYKDFVPNRMLVLMLQDTTFQKKLQREVQIKQDEIRKAYTELLEQNRQLQELDRAKDRFIALTTHELRTPLSAIVATAEVLVSGLFEGESQRQDLTQTILDQGHQLMELVNDILDFAKIRAGKMDYFVENLNLGKILTKVIATYRKMAEQYHVELNLKAPREEVLVWADSIRMREVLNNVVSNAIKYNKSGGRVDIEIREIAEYAQISVRDTGKGIPDESKSAVFNEFETVGNVATHHKGTGLGMPISKQLIEAMGGSINFESKVGVGTTFYIKIPKEKVLNPDWYRSRTDENEDLAA